MFRDSKKFWMDKFFLGGYRGEEVIDRKFGNERVVEEGGVIRKGER